jgi:hypothetical protein
LRRGSRRLLAPTRSIITGLHTAAIPERFSTGVAAA